MNTDKHRLMLSHGTPCRHSASLYLRSSVFICGSILLLCVLNGCKRDDMAEQPRYDPLEPSQFFADGKSSRELVPGTVPRNRDLPSQARYEAQASGQEMTAFPIEIGLKELKRGQERFNIYCTPCHGYSGDGDGMIVQRGLTRPPSFHAQRLRDASPGHFFNVITNGYGAMYSYAERVSVEDRWMITAYIRALQLSRNANVADLTAEDRSKLQAAATQPTMSQPALTPVNELTTRPTTQAEHPETTPR